MLTPARTEPSMLSAGLIASLATATWLDTDPAGATLCCLLLVPQPNRVHHEAPAVIEQRMLGLDPLSRSATPAEIDSYLDLGTLRQRLLFGHTRTE
ncbi:hypothetical protein ACWDSL_23700 [Streptomyces sp. NPDC000941]